MCCVSNVIYSSTPMFLSTVTLEQVVGELVADHVVELLPGLGGEPHQEPVQLARHVHQLRVEEGGGERDGGGGAAQRTSLHQAAGHTRHGLQLLLGSPEQARHQRVPEPERCRGEAVDYRGVHRVIISGDSGLDGDNKTNKL